MWAPFPRGVSSPPLAGRAGHGLATRPAGPPRPRAWPPPRAGARAARPGRRARGRGSAPRGRSRAGRAGTCGLSASRNRRISPLSAAWAAAMRGLAAAATIAPCRSAWASLIALHGGSSPAHAALQPRERLVHGRREAAAVALEREVRGLQLERRAQLVQPAHVVAAELGDVRAAVRLDPHQALGGERAQRRPQRVAGDAVGLAQLALAQPVAGGQLAVEDLAPQRVGEGVDGRRALERSRRGHRQRIMPRRARPRATARGAAGMRTASASRPASTSPAPVAEAAVSGSDSTTAPSTPAVSGSASVSVAVSEALRPRRPRANSVYAAAVGIRPRNRASAMPSACSSQPEPAREQRGQQHDGPEPERDRHHRLRRVPVRHQPLGGERVARVRAARDDRERDAGSRHARVAAAEGEQHDAGTRERGRGDPAALRPAAIDDPLEQAGQRGRRPERDDRADRHAGVGDRGEERELVHGHAGDRGRHGHRRPAAAAQAAAARQRARPRPARRRRRGSAPRRRRPGSAPSGPSAWAVPVVAKHSAASRTWRRATLGARKRMT